MAMQFFEITPAQRKLGNMGRKIMDLAAVEKDDAMSNQMSVIGNMLTTVGAPFGTRLNQLTSTQRQFIAMLIKRYPEIQE
jgi:hypothetical protein